MRQEKIRLIRHSLVRKLEELWSIADGTISQMKNNEGNFADPFDQAAMETNKFVELACRDRERQLILDIKETIIRIDRGMFGICDRCGSVISEERLLIEPLSRLCATCQEIRETGCKQKNRWRARRGISDNHVW
jgi:DnaK suppressor protein